MTNEEIQHTVTEIKEPENEKMKSFKKIQYEMADIGKVVEELKVEIIKFIKDDPKEETIALHKVYINDELVREVDFVNDKVIKSDSRYEPWSFLHMDQSTFRQMQQQHFFDIINTFRYYKSYNLKKVQKRIDFISTMSSAHQNILKNYSKHLTEIQTSILHNYEIIKVIIGDAAKIFRNHLFLKDNKKCPLTLKLEKDLDISRIDSILNQIVREWCHDGVNERESCFVPILNTIEEYFPMTENRNQIRILVPGAGLGRLPYEIAKRGYSCQGNEFSLMMLFVANFILNKIDSVDVFTFYPWVSHFSNNLYSGHQIIPAKFPDVNPATISKDVDFSMVAGSFTEIFNQHRNQFDCVVTCFFLDTAQNIVSYIETICNILKPGGIWINFGPLLYHYADMTECSIEPSYEIVKEIIESFNFKFLKEKTNQTCYYTKNPNSMVSYQYHSIFFVCHGI
ncbi:N2227-like protein [Euroglyphus maynei]|uniref:carnosine N-methyltransferase n=1 Tax=Euroglyphus maynei TaxID=6958 RepID=A0A1Y3APN5_EURMA|nr:N2227-like protein [Euroglyphus maynei]